MAQYFDGAHLTARELGSIGRMLMQNGRWNQNVLIEHVEMLTTATPAAAGFGLTGWLNSEIEDGASFLDQVPERILLRADTSA